jgi:ADP-dependent NAD(P)H-hydrate dehydratase / NAD(P)H-hydrate epimerase
MKIFPAEAVQKIDSYTIENEPITSINLMERAALRLKDWFVRHYRVNRRVVVLAGPGNNGGDALALARMLSDRQYRVEVCVVSTSGKLSGDCAVNLERLEQLAKVPIIRVKATGNFPVISSEDVVVDGLFGSGITRVVEGVYKELIGYLNNSGATVISVDIPSGLFGEDNRKNDPAAIVRADYTLTFQFPFLSFFFAENEPYTGKWKVLDIGLHPAIIERTKTSYSTISRQQVPGLLPERRKFSHKGTYGNALAISGSSGMMGAAMLTGEAALRSGAGIITLHVPRAGFRVVQTAFPEAIVSLDNNEDIFSMPPDLEKFSAVAVGPGLGTSQESMTGLQILLENMQVPLVIDADALNMISENREMISMIPPGSILTPHPLEFDRLAGRSEDGMSRHEKQLEFSEKHHLLVVLKGAYTGISFPDGTYLFNTTGNPGMATGGSGDVLTGIIVSLLAQGLSPEDAAVAAVYLHGVAGDVAAEKYGMESMIAGDIIKCIGSAFTKVKSSPFLHEGRMGVLIQ